MERKNFITLDLNESYYFLDGKILNKFKKFDYSVLSLYPEYDQLTKMLSKYAGCKEENICLTNGSDRGIQMLLNLFFKAKDEVVVPSPTFSVYFSVLKEIGVKPKMLKYKLKDKKFLFPFEETLKSLNTNCKGLLLCNPNNPLGSSISQKQIEMMIKKAKSLSIPVLIDEAYFEFSKKTSLSLLSKYNNVIILRTFSKAFGLAGLRLGYIMAHKSIIQKVEELKLAWSVNHFAVHAGEIVLKNLPYFKNKIKRAIKIKKEFIIHLQKTGLKCLDTEANFILIKSTKNNLPELFKSKRILVKDLSKYPFQNGLLNHTVRANIPSEKDLKYIKRVLKKNN